MDIATLTQLISVGKDFLGGGDSEDGGLPKAKEYRPNFDKYKMGTDTYGFADSEALSEPGQAAQIQQVSYKQTQQFWDNYLRDYMGDI